MGIEIKGFDDIFETLDDMNISDRKKRRVLKEGGEIVRQAVVDNSPVRTSKMKKSWKLKIKRFDGNLGFEVKEETLNKILKMNLVHLQIKNILVFLVML